MKKLKEELKYGKRGITLIALVITIIVLLILAGVTIATLTGENGILTRTMEAKFKTEISDIKEQIEIKGISNSKENAFGTVNGILEVESSYNEKLAIENGNLVYDAQKFSKEEIEWLEELGILPKGNYYLIMMENTKSKFAGQTNIGTMQEFSELVNSGDFSYDVAYIIEDINLNCSATNQWITIGNENINFTSVIEGNDYTISGLYIDNTNSYQGLFGNNGGTIKNIKIDNLYIKSDVGTGRSTSGGIVGYNTGTVENCQVTNSNIIASGNNVGGIVGWNENGGTIKNCTNSAKITNTGTYSTGGIVGWNNNNSEVYNCSNLGDITGSANVGGIAGTNQANSVIEDSYNNGDILSNAIDTGTSEVLGIDCQILDSRVGGICGSNPQGYINKSYNIGQIEGLGNNIGGISGICESFIQEKGVSIENCYNKGKIIGTGDLIKEGENNVYGGADSGGICGRIVNNATIKTCYNLGDVEGVYLVGGIIGELGIEDEIDSLANIENCYNTGNTKTKSTTKGGIIGKINYGNIEKCYYLNTTENGIGTGNNTDEAELKTEAKTETEMKSTNFINILNADYDEKLWNIDSKNINSGYPIFTWQ